MLGQIVISLSSEASVYFRSYGSSSSLSSPIVLSLSPRRLSAAGGRGGGAVGGHFPARWGGFGEERKCVAGDLNPNGKERSSGLTRNALLSSLVLFFFAGCVLYMCSVQESLSF